MTAPVKRAYVVRDATEDDLEAMVAVKLRGWADAYGPLIDPEILRPLLDPRPHLTRLRRLFHQPGTLLLVAVERKQEVVLGFALTDMAHQPEPLLESLHVSAAVRGLGIGPKFLNVMTDGRREVEKLTGQREVPVLVTDSGEIIQDSQKIADWAAENPAPQA